MPDPTCPDAAFALSRRGFLAGAATLSVWPFLPRFAAAAPGGRDPRLIVVVLRGAMDGLSAVAPVGDPAYAALRGTIALGLDGPNPALGLDGFFALHPAMPTFARLYKAGKAMVVHAVASPYRERSHFDGQDVLESGLGGVGRTDSGWLNRALQVLPAGERIVRAGGLGVGTMTPLIMRGAAPVLGWSPQVLPQASDDFAARVLDLYRHTDGGLAETLERGLATDKLAAQAGMGEARSRAGAATAEGMKLVAAGAARLLAAADGPRLAALSFDGWDTHANEGGATGRLAQLLGGLDGAFAALESGLGPAWRDTAVLVATEFGRTAAVNGTVGTDHGTATVAFLAGGAIKGGRILTDWPGLRPADLYEARDLKPTTDLRAIAKGLLADHLGLSRTLLDTSVFPDSAAVAPTSGLIG